jgi:transposase
MVQAAVTNNSSNAVVEQVNTQIRLIMRRGFGFQSPWSVIALAMLSLGGLCPPLPAEGA